MGKLHVVQFATCALLQILLRTYKTSVRGFLLITHARRETELCRYWSSKMNGRCYHFGDRVARGCVTIKWIMKQWACGCGLEDPESYQDSVGSVNSGKFLGQLSG